MNKAFELALDFYGLKEVPGKDHNSEILEMFAEVGHSWVQDDETAWCAAFVGYCLSKTGYVSTRKLNARSYLDIGHRTESPQVGDIVVFWRVKEKSVYGHVAFYINERDGYINVLGGNQSNQVKISSYPKRQLLQFRKLELE